MVKKILFVAASAAIVFAPVAFAQVITTPTSTANSITANVASQFADTGFLTLVVLAAAIPLLFYVVRQLIGLLPHSRSGRRT